MNKSTSSEMNKEFSLDMQIYHSKIKRKIVIPLLTSLVYYTLLLIFKDSITLLMELFMQFVCVVVTIIFAPYIIQAVKLVQFSYKYNAQYISNNNRFIFVLPSYRTKKYDFKLEDIVKIDTVKSEVSYKVSIYLEGGNCIDVYLTKKGYETLLEVTDKVEHTLQDTTVNVEGQTT